MPPVGTTAGDTLLAYYFNGTVPAAISDVYVALLTVSNGGWTASTSYTVGETIYVIVSSVTYIMKCTTAGTSGATAPTWVVTEGATTADNTAVWTEQTIAIRGGTFTEATGGGYARYTAATTTANWTLSVDANNREKVVNAVLFNYGTVTAALGWCTAAVVMSALTAGSVLFWWGFSQPVNVTSSSTPQLPAGGESFAIG